MVKVFYHLHYLCGQMLPGQLQHFSVGLHLYSEMFHTIRLQYNHLKVS